MNITYNITNFGDFLSFVNTQGTFGFFGLGILLLLFGVGMMEASRKYPFHVSAFFVLLLLFPVTIILVLLNLLPSSSVFIYLILLSLVGTITFIRRSKEVV